VSRHLLAIDQGTTGATALVLAEDGRTLGRHNVEFPQHFPEPGQVEHEPEEIWQSVLEAVREALLSAQVAGAEIAAIGITNQRETTLLWERATGNPVCRAIVWQDTRTQGACKELILRGFEGEVKERTGLVIHPYFSASKLSWMLEHVPGVRARAEASLLAFGTVDSFLVYRLAGGARHAAPHVTDVTNASRTMLMNLRQRSWDPWLCRLWSIPEAVLPSIVGSASPVAVTASVPGLPDGIRIAGIAGDQHAALFGQACFSPGQVKCTYGTGAFVLVNTGPFVRPSRHGLLSTMAWQIGSEAVYALEGSAFVAGAAVQWLRDGLGLFERSSDIEALAASVPESDGVTFVPALVGLGAPHWDPRARGLISGITRGTTRAHLARATLEAIALEVNDLVEAMKDDLGSPITGLAVDGGAAANNLLLQLQADLSQVPVLRPREIETTARGAAMLAGIGAGLFSGPEDAARLGATERVFQPALGSEKRDRLLASWKAAILRARGQPVPE
jgi:glycerol kinase